MKYILLCVLFTSVGCGNKLIETTAEYRSEVASFRSTYKANFMKQPNGPLAENDLTNLDFFKADANYRCKCKVDVPSIKEAIEVDTYAGKKKNYLKYATALCNVGGKKIYLAIYSSSKVQLMPVYRDHLFLPFMDHTNGESSYGGGRYIDLKTGDVTDDNYIIIDFNKCYNPYCAYSDGYNCPIPPLENHLDLAIMAGEKNFLGKKKKRK